MATTYNNCQMGIVDTSGNLSVIYPQTKASLVSCDSAKYGGSSNVTNVQSALNNLSSAYSSLGTAAAKNYTTSVTSGSSSLVTSGGVYSYLDSNYMTKSYSEGTISGGSAGISGSVVYYRVGKMVVINGTFSTSQQLVASTLLFTVPSGYRPQCNLSILVGIAGYGQAINGIVRASDGAVYCINNDIAAGLYLIFDICYAIK